MDCKSEPALSVLVVDDEAGNVRLLEAFLRKQGHRVLVARDGASAVAAFEAEVPDVVLLDVMMPGMNGFTAAERMRALSPERWVPIVFLSAMDGVANMVKGLSAGGDDYLVKPVNLGLLQCKIAALRRVAQLQSNLLERSRELARYRDENERELALARHLFTHLAREEQGVDARLQCQVVPAQTLSGDVLSASLGADHKLRIMLADANGHGLVAAVNVLPMVEIFQAMAGKGFSCEAIARELDRKLQRFFPPDRFVATALVCLDFQEQFLSVWNAGLPPLLLLDATGRVEREFSSRGLPCGLNSGVIDAATVEQCRFDFGAQLAIYSNGLIETLGPDGSRFGQQGLRAALGGAVAAERFDRLWRAVHAHGAGQDVADDMSFALVDLRPQAHAAGSAHESGRHVPPGLRVAMAFGPVSLAQRDNVPRIIAAVTEIAGHCDEIESLHLVLAEMFHNAVDHGLLGLDSAIKNEADGFERYLALRARRLAELADGQVQVEVVAAAPESGAKLCVTVTDSGPGFDFRQRLEQGPDADGKLFHGRGISLMRMVAKRVEYIGCGNAVRVWI
ncbi:MAG: SpoIIE family protein phosphatase [Rhodocyclaceae bacterium]|nr:SpoIIE family protein phosphatase [Rhodocyclaceae bacterium]